MRLDRRTFVKGALGATGVALLGEAIDRQPGDQGSLARETEPAVASSDPAASSIEHVVVVMMENRSFDHFLGWLPHANGRQHGLSYADPGGRRHKTFKQEQFNGCGYTDPDHSYTGGRIQYADGKMNGFLTDTANDLYAISYYTHAQRPFMGTLATHYTTCDNYFCSILAPTYPNRFFQHAGQTDRLDDSLTISTLPTIWDQLNRAGGPTGTYYYSDLPFLALWGDKYTSISEPVSAFMAAAEAGTLPNVSYVDPRFIGESNGTSDDDHPLADIRAGDAFLSELFHAVSSGPAWPRTVFIINYDEWGGFFEHVAPSRVTAGVPIGASPSSGVDQDLDAKGHVLLGFRVPCIVASPFTSVEGGSQRVAHGRFDHTSILKLIEWRWGLEPLTQRDASRASFDPGNLARVLNLGNPDPKVSSTIPVLPPFVPTACSSEATTAEAGEDQSPVVSAVGVPGDSDKWKELQYSSLMDAWR